jgi:hypothetical protein
MPPCGVRGAVEGDKKQVARRGLGASPERAGVVPKMDLNGDGDISPKE